MKTQLSVLMCAILIVVDARADSLSIGPATQSGSIQIDSRDTRQQLIVTRTTGEQTLDVTRKVKFSVQPAELLSIDESGLATPLADGEAVVSAADGDLQQVLPRGGKPVGPALRRRSISLQYCRFLLRNL